MSERRTALVAKVREHAERHYNRNGWDFLVECWSDADILEQIGKASTLHAAISACRNTCMALDDRRRESKAEAY